MRYLLCVALLVGGCAGKTAPELTPGNVKRGGPRLHVGFPGRLQFNTGFVLRIMIQGSDISFKRYEYALAIQIGRGSQGYIIYPRRQRYYEFRVDGREQFTAPAGNMPLSVSLYEIESFDWKGDPVLGTRILHSKFLIPMVGVHAG